MGFPVPKGLKRCYGRGHLHCLTFSCYRRLPLLATVRARQPFVRELTRVRAEYGFLLIGYVVMPEHVHLLISEPRKGTPSTVLQMLNQRVSIGDVGATGNVTLPSMWNVPPTAGAAGNCAKADPLTTNNTSAIADFIPLSRREISRFQCAIPSTYSCNTPAAG